MDETTVRDRVREFLSTHLRTRELGDGDDIFAMGYANSLFAMQLVVFVEKEFAATLGPEDMQMENFRSVDGLVRLVGAKTGAGV
jgi:methoxymalonate biosynthesis acyl carrier protein